MMVNVVSSVLPAQLAKLLCLLVCLFIYLFVCLFACLFVCLFFIYFFPCADDYSLVVAQNLQLWQLDLSSLETISGGGMLFFNNPQLCYVGNFSTYLDNLNAQHQCVVSPFRKDPQTCSEYTIIIQLA